MILIFSLFLLAAIIVVPIRIAAQTLGARKVSYTGCFIAIIASIAAGMLAAGIATNSALAFIITLLFAGMAFSVILDTGYKQGVAIALLSYVIQIGASFILLALGISALST